MKQVQTDTLVRRGEIVFGGTKSTDEIRAAAERDPSGETPAAERGGGRSVDRSIDGSTDHAASCARAPAPTHSQPGRRLSVLQAS